MKTTPSNTYTVCFSRPFESATIRMRASCFEEAMANAKLIVSQRFRWLRFKADIPARFRAITQIDVVHDRSGEALRWLAEHVRGYVYSQRLLEAARNVIAKWETGDLAAAVRKLGAVVAEADGGDV